MTTSLTKGMPRRETCTQAPPGFSLVWWPDGGVGLSKRAWRRLAVVQPPITSSPAVRQLLWISMASVVTLESSMMFGTALISAGLVMTDTGALTRSKIVPRFTAKGSLRWPTKSLAGWLQPGMLTV